MTQASQQQSSGPAQVQTNGGLLDPNFAYVSSAQTDVRETFKRFGWQEPNRAHQDFMRRRLNAI